SKRDWSSDVCSSDLAIISQDELIQLQNMVQEVYIAKNIQRYIMDLVTQTRNQTSIYLGVSPRGSIALMKASKAYAYIQGRDYVLPDDVKYLAPFVLAHRIILTSQAKYDGITNEQALISVIERIPIPIRKEMS